MSHDARPAGPRPPHAFTVDVEDYFQVSGFERHVPRETWPNFTPRVEDNTRRLLDLLARPGVRGTFFVLGWTAERFPGLVREIAACGHEIASHGYAHRLIYDQTPAEFRADVARGRDVLQEIVGRPVTMYRAPSFSIVQRSLWALEVLVEEGFLLDSSIFPIRHDRYGIPAAPRVPHLRQTPAGPIREFPPAVLRLAGQNIPFGGGGYFRLLPASWLVRAYHAVSASRPWGSIFYLHPWEIDPDQPRVPGSGFLSNLRHRLGLRSAAAKLEILLSDLRWGTVTDALGDVPVDPNAPLPEGSADGQAPKAGHAPHAGSKKLSGPHWAADPKTAVR